MPATLAARFAQLYMDLEPFGVEIVGPQVADTYNALLEEARALLGSNGDSALKGIPEIGEETPARTARLFAGQLRLIVGA